MSVKYFGLYASQPCRTVLYTLRRLGIEYQHNEIRPRFDTRADWFKKGYNRYGYAPVLEYEGVKMIESASISRFLWAKYDSEELIMPRKDLIRRQKVDSILDVNLYRYRPVLMQSYWDIILSPIWFGSKKPSDEQCAQTMKRVHNNFKDINTLSPDTEYLTGDNMTLADLQVYNEVKNWTHHFELDLEEYPWIKKWWDRMHSDALIAELDDKMIWRLY